LGPSGPFGAVGGRRGPLEGRRGPLEGRRGPSGPTRGHRGPSRTIRAIPGPTGPGELFTRQYCNYLTTGQISYKTQNFKICFLGRKMYFPLFRSFHIPKNLKIFHGIPPIESAFYYHPIPRLKKIIFILNSFRQHLLSSVG
jgi:hypothetical protein